MRGPYAPTRPSGATALRAGPTTEPPELGYGSHVLSRVSTHYRGPAGERYFAYQHRDAERRALARARELQPHIRPGDRLVDFGCGAGYVLLQLQAREKVGVEGNPTALAEAASKGVSAVASLDELHGEAFDIAVSSHALEHTLQPFTELQGLRRVLTPGGRLILQLPINDWRNEREPDPNDINHHLYTWTPLLIGNLLIDAGFKVLSAKVVNYGWPGRFTGVLAQSLSPRAFNLVAAFTAVLLKRRELRVVALRPEVDGE